LPIFNIETEEEVFTTLNRIDNTGESASRLRRVLESNPKATLGFSDLIPMAASMIRCKQSTVIRVPMPTEFGGGLTYEKEGFVVFYHCLQAYIGSKGGIERVSPQIKWIQNAYQSLKAKYPEWENDILASQRTNDRSRAFLEELHAYWEDTTAYFVNLQRTHKTYPTAFLYYDLMCSHICHAVRFYEDATLRIRMGQGREHFGLRTPWLAEGMHLYFDYLPNIIEDMNEKGFNDEDLGDRGSTITEAWLTMVFRAFCWHRCHYLVPGNRVHSEYYGSQMPVYIG
jgi:hypothetical protein